MLAEHHEKRSLFFDEDTNGKLIDLSIANREFSLRIEAFFN